MTRATAFLLSMLLSEFAYANVNVAWPNPYPKQLAAVRRRPGLTTAEFLYHHTFVHGLKSWNAPDSVDQPLAYVQDHIFDSAYGINTSAPGSEPTYFGHSDMTELYSRSETAFSTPPPNNYTATVIGPDGIAFADFSAAVSMYAYEKFQHVNSTCGLPRLEQPFNAFFWLFANSTVANTTSFDNTTFAQNAYDALAAQLPDDVVYNASIHTPVPGLDSRPYYGGYGNPPLNAVLKFWLCNDNQAVSGFRRVQKALIAENDRLGINLADSFVFFTRPYLVYDRHTGQGFSYDRAVNAVLADRFRGDVTGPPSDSN
ncbi:hypothetical protein KCU65_g10088, partial [Aureobasidium melanogenum]